MLSCEKICIISKILFIIIHKFITEYILILHLFCIFPFFVCVVGIVWHFNLYCGRPWLLYLLQLLLAVIDPKTKLIKKSERHNRERQWWWCIENLKYKLSVFSVHNFVSPFRLSSWWLGKSLRQHFVFYFTDDTLLRKIKNSNTSLISWVVHHEMNFI